MYYDHLPESMRETYEIRCNSSIILRRIRLAGLSSSFVRQQSRVPATWSSVVFFPVINNLQTLSFQGLPTLYHKAGNVVIGNWEHPSKNSKCKLS